MINKIFVADIGNSYSKIAIIDSNNKVIEKLYFKTENKFNEEFLEYRFLELKKNHIISGAIIGSVISKHTNIFKKVATSVFKVKPYLMDESTKLSFTLKEIDRNIVGQDILALAEYCSRKNENAVGFSFGTAMFALYLKNNNLEGVTISPGLGLSFNQLASKIKTLKYIKLDFENKEFKGKNTISALETGINNIRTGFVINFYNNVLKDNVNNNFYCVLTGGEVADVEIDHEYEIDTNAVLKGYSMIYFENNN